MSDCASFLFSDRDDKGVMINGSSWLLYEPFHKPQSYLSLHLVLNPLQPDGTIVQRIRTCALEKCRHNVNISLVDGKPRLEVFTEGSRLEITSNTTVQVRLYSYDSMNFNITDRWCDDKIYCYLFCFLYPYIFVIFLFFKNGPVLYRM